MKKFWKEVRKPLWRLLCLIIPLFSAAWAFGLFAYFYWFAESYAQSCVWAVWCVFSLLVYKIKQYEL